MKLTFTAAAVLLLLTLQLRGSVPADTTIFGENPGFYGSGWTDQQIYDAMAVAGCNATRSGVSIQQWAQFGFAPFAPRLQYPYTSKGFRHNVFFLYALPNQPVYTGQSDSMVNGHQVILPQNLYLPPFNADGTINRSNYWAAYAYDWCQSLGPYYSYVEVDNEPDQTSSSHNFQDSTHDTLSWQNHEPQPKDLVNTYSSVEDYVQLCKITNQVVKKYFPATMICTGGLGSSWFYNWFLKKGGGKWVDKISFHLYPYYSWFSCVFIPPGICGPASWHRHSDELITLADSTVKIFRYYDSVNGGARGIICTEANTPRWTFDTSTVAGAIDKRWGNSHVNRNFLFKAIPYFYAHLGLEFFSSYQTAETADSGSLTGAGFEISAMGLYKNFTDISPGQQQLTPQGQAAITLMHFLHNYSPDKTQPVAPPGTRVLRFDSAGNKIYIAWAETTIDESEVAAGSFILPPSVTFQEFLYDGSSPGAVTDTVALTGDPAIFVQITSPLPTFITSFTGQVTPAANDLYWSLTTTDIISAIEVQRSPDGTHFGTIASLDPRTRFFADPNPNGSYYYRLLITGEGQTLAVSDVIWLYRPSVAVRVYPSPFRETFTIELPRPSAVKIYDLTGRLIQSLRLLAGTHQLHLFAPAGTYIVKIISDQATGAYLITKF